MLQKSTRQRRNEQACEVELNNRKTNFLADDEACVCVGKGSYTGLGVWLSSEKKNKKSYRFKSSIFRTIFARWWAIDNQQVTRMRQPWWTCLPFISPFGFWAISIGFKWDSCLVPGLGACFIAEPSSFVRLWEIGSDWVPLIILIFQLFNPEGLSSLFLLMAYCDEYDCKPFSSF